MNKSGMDGAVAGQFSFQSCTQLDHVEEDCSVTLHRENMLFMEAFRTPALDSITSRCCSVVACRSL